MKDNDMITTPVPRLRRAPGRDGRSGNINTARPIGDARDYSTDSNIRPDTKLSWMSNLNTLIDAHNANVSSDDDIRMVCPSCDIQHPATATIWPRDVLVHCPRMAEMQSVRPYL